MLLPLDGPSKQLKITIDTVTPALAKADTLPKPERKVLTLQGNGRFYVYFADESGAPNAATVLANGFLQFKDQIETYEAADSQDVYLLAVSGTVDVVVAERA